MSAQLSAKQILDGYLATLCPTDKVSIRTMRGISMTEYYIVGPLEDVQAAIGKLFDAYHPAGYGTMVNHLVYDAGQYRARMSRANSSE